MIQKFISLPPNAVSDFYQVAGVECGEWFATSDPAGARIGSGGGTAWVMEDARNAGVLDASAKRIILHAGGQSRRLPAYAPMGKIFTPIPVMRWARGERLTQNLMTRQMPLFEKILEKAPSGLNTLIASGDVYIHTSRSLPEVPEADVVVYGLWDESGAASSHGVFAIRRDGNGKLDRMLQKPSAEELAALTHTHLYLLDIGVWLLSDRAMELLDRRSRARGTDGKLGNYDLYGEFGYALGSNAPVEDEELNALTVKVVPLDGGGFYHYGTSRELISSTLRLQNLVCDQRAILQSYTKPHPAMFVQNALIGLKLHGGNSELWVENSFIPETWTLHAQHVITGVPENNWTLNLPQGVCIDIVPVGTDAWAVRPYGFNDPFRGMVGDAATLYQGVSFQDWASERGVDIAFTGRVLEDLQSVPLFPVVRSIEEMGIVLRWMTGEPALAEGARIWLEAEKLSADTLMERASLIRIGEQRERFYTESLQQLAANHRASVFYQSDLAESAATYARHGLELPAPLSPDTEVMTRVRDAMFRSRTCSLTGDEAAAERWSREAFGLLSESLVAVMGGGRQHPRMTTHRDQIVWGRSPVRVDLAGGWTDTPPYCLNSGGAVVNVAIELNGQPPLQVYVKPSAEPRIILRSIDLGAQETVTTFEELRAFNKLNSPFSIPKASLALAGFLPEFCSVSYASLEEQLRAFGCGIEVTLLAAIPAGSGLGTSSVLGGTVLGTISDFCGLGWDRNEICNRTLVLEQLLTSGGGWQDQYGGILPGVKLLTTHAGLEQRPEIRWASDSLFTGEETRSCHLLYYTGITRTAKSILGEIVKNMFLNSEPHLRLLGEMRSHAGEMFEALQHNDWNAYGQLINRTWTQNQLLDSGTNPPAVRSLIERVEKYCSGLKLPGAGGGGYLYMVARDPDAAAHIRRLLNSAPENENARFVEMSLSNKGFVVSKS